MVRRLRREDIGTVVDIWLRASIRAHCFVPPEFWEEKAGAMRDVYLPNAETWVVEDEGKVAGFFCLVDDVLAAIFVDPERQGMGLGSELIEKAKALRDRIELSVYEENPGAVAFYRKRGFVVSDERQDVHTSHNELVMEWKREKGTP